MSNSSDTSESHDRPILTLSDLQGLETYKSKKVGVGSGQVGTRQSTPRVNPGSASRTAAPAYTVIAVSTYPADLVALDAAVLRLKQAGIRRMSRSWLLRIALERLDVDAVLAELLEVAR